MSRHRFDLGIVIALKEEFRYVLEMAPQLEVVSHAGTYFYRLDFGDVTALACLIGQMGPLPALQATIRLLDFADVKLLVVLGLAGGLDSDVQIGDVVIASEVNEFQANSKAESEGTGFAVRYSGRHWPLGYRIREAISHFEFSGETGFQAWRLRASADYSNLDIPDKQLVCTALPSLHLGALASGGVVAASEAFVAEVRRIDRKFIAIDMESAGVAPAATERIHPVQCLVIRGISDHGNDKKHVLDEQGKGAWRRYCVRNATSLLRHLVSWHGFLGAAGLRSISAATSEQQLVVGLLQRLHDCVGGSWLVGVMFGIYAHGPSLNDKEASPTDIFRLRVLHPIIADLLDRAEAQKVALFEGVDLDTAVSVLRELMLEFRTAEGSIAIASRLSDFDKVVIDIVFPLLEDDEDLRILRECDQLEEEAGPGAVVELLADVPQRRPLVRERYVDVLAQINAWSKIIDCLRLVSCDQLSRSELEHLIAAHGRAGRPVTGLLRVYQGLYKDKAAHIFLQGVGRSSKNDVHDSPEDR